MNKFKEREKFLKSVKLLIKEITSLGLSVEGSRNINDDTAFEIIVAKEEGVEEKLKKLEDFMDLTYDGFILNKGEDSYKVIYCQKNPERKLRDGLFAHLVDLGFLIKETGEIPPNKGLIFHVKTKDSELLKKLENYETLVFDGYITKGDNGEYEIFYIFPEGN